MARRSFDMSLRLSITDTDVAKAALAAAKDPRYCHNLLLGRLLEVGAATAAELVAWLNANAGLMTEEGAARWAKYSAGCHVAYFINRFRGAVKGTRTDGSEVMGAARKAKKAEPAAEQAEEQAEVNEAVLADATA